MRQLVILVMLSVATLFANEIDIKTFGTIGGVSSELQI
jgi:hypothetical protein